MEGYCNQEQQLNTGKQRHFWEKIAELSTLLLILNTLKPSYILPEQLNELSVSQLTHCTQRRSAVQG